MILDASGVALALGYLRRRGARAGEPNRNLVHSLVREGKLPPPIDPTLSIAHWRWSRKVIEQYVAGEWQPTGRGRPDFNAETGWARAVRH